MRRIYTIVALGIALTAFIGLAVFGFAIWVFIPMLPAAIILIIVLVAAGRKSTVTEADSKVTQADSSKDSNTRKAA